MLITAGIESVVLALPHRGRLSLLTDPTLLNFSPTALFAKIKGEPEFDPATAPGATGDVISHLSATRSIGYKGKAVKVQILQNPSHLEVRLAILHEYRKVADVRRSILLRLVSPGLSRCRC
jgi:2-oxoglutarate dehydrogenase complex dehydrogenase (E1) component-like enzyme